MWHLGWAFVDFVVLLILMVGGAVMLLELRVLLRRTSEQATLAAQRAHRADVAAVAAEAQTRRARHSVVNLDSAVRMAFGFPDGKPEPVDGTGDLDFDEEVASQ